MYTCVYTLYFTYTGKSGVTYSATSTEISISWEHATSPADCGTVSYILNLHSLNATDDNTTRTTIENRARFIDLSNGTTYIIIVTAVNRAGTMILYTISVTTKSEGKECSVFIYSTNVDMYVHTYIRR